MAGNQGYGRRLFLHASLLLGVVLSMFPFYWLTVMATRTNSDIYRFPPKLTFGDQLLININNVMANIDFWGAFLNTLFVSAVSTLLVLFFCSIAGFTFAKFDFPGKNVLFVLLLATLMIPPQLSLVPSFIIMQQLGWVGTFKSLIVPTMANAFGIFWMRQYAHSTIHDDLLNAGRIDGCNQFRLFWNVGLPILRPALAFLGIFTFVQTWNDYLWPLIILNNPAKYTLQVTLAQLHGVFQTDLGMVMAGTLLATIPLIIVFLLVSRQFISDLAAGGIKD